MPFIGSGAECVATKKLGLDYLGFEINEDYIKITEQRLSLVKKSESLNQFLVS
ncbi:MAG: DNA methyltransferase [Nanoarchaeota archaeon]